MLCKASQYKTVHNINALETKTAFDTVKYAFDTK